MSRASWLTGEVAFPASDASSPPASTRVGYGVLAQCTSLRSGKETIRAVHLNRVGYCLKKRAPLHELDTKRKHQKTER